MIPALTARRRDTFTLPESGTACVTPTYDGSGTIIHPSVVDMGFKWHGFRWWRADTPWPGADDTLENPSIWGSNDRINWTVPEGLTNPIYPWSTVEGEFNSDTELVWDPSRAELVCYWREYKPTTIYMMAATSPDGVTWTQQGVRLTLTKQPWMSPGIARAPSGEWRMMLFRSANLRPWIRTAPTSLGPWSEEISTSGLGQNYHGDMIYAHGLWWCIFIRNKASNAFGATSADGYTWAYAVDLGIPAYRPTMCPSTEAGYMDVWTSDPSKYWRLPMSSWGHQ